MIKDKFYIRIILVVTATNPLSSNHEDNKSLIIKTDDGLSFPFKYLLSSQTPSKIAEEILTEYTGISSGWTAIIPVGTIYNGKDNAIIDILFTCFIPEPTRIKIENSVWLSHLEISNGDNEELKKLLYESIWKKI
jgi:hypothetical protein